MNKEERIKKYGIEAYKKLEQQSRDWSKNHSEEWRSQNQDKIKIAHQEENRKGGKYYEQKCKYISTGIPHERELVRRKHQHRYRPYKQIIAPDSVLHHEWLPETANYRGVALVEAYQHQYGIVDVIQILEGEITLLTEEEIRRE